MLNNEEKKANLDNLKKKILLKKRNGILKTSEEVVLDSDDFCEGYKKFLNISKTEREFVYNSVKIAEKKGFTKFDHNKKYKSGDKVYQINRNKALILAVIGKKGTKDGVKIAVSHVDSPRLDLKPIPLYESNELALFKTHYYGGIKKYQWTAIPLSMHGTIVKKDGSTIEINIGENEGEPCFCVTDLLPHLAKEQMAKSMVKSFTGEDLNILVGSRPIKNEEDSELVKLNVMKIINEKYGILESDFISAEIEFVPAAKSKDIGIDRSMIGAYGHDDRVCAYTSLMAILDSEIPEKTIITILADKEEIGSYGNTGMDSNFLKYFIEDLADQDNLKCRHILSKSKCLSADVNAAFDPNYPSVYEELNSCYINNGVVITKYTGSGGKYDTSDASAEYMGEIRSMLEKECIVWQTGQLGKVDSGGGGTIAKYIAKLNVDVVDLGVPVLSMHSPMEVVSKFDVYMAYKTFAAFFK